MCLDMVKDGRFLFKGCQRRKEEGYRRSGQQEVRKVDSGRSGQREERTTGGEDKGRSRQQEEWTARRTTGGADSYKGGG